MALADLKYLLCLNYCEKRWSPTSWTTIVVETILWDVLPKKKEKTILWDVLQLPLSIMDDWVTRICKDCPWSIDECNISPESLKTNGRDNSVQMFIWDCHDSMLIVINLLGSCLAFWINGFGLLG